MVTGARGATRYEPQDGSFAHRGVKLAVSNEHDRSMALARKTPYGLSLVLVLLLLGCRSVRQRDTTLAALRSTLDAADIESYLATGVGISGFGGRVFCAYEPLDAQQAASGKLFIWALCQEYYVEEGALALGSGLSLPVELLLEEKNGGKKIVGHAVPRDGAYFGRDVRATFPRSTWSQIMPRSRQDRAEYNDRASQLAGDAEMSARLHYGIKAP